MGEFNISRRFCQIAAMISEDFRIFVRRRRYRDIIDRDTIGIRRLRMKHNRGK